VTNGKTGHVGLWNLEGRVPVFCWKESSVEREESVRKVQKRQSREVA
jgi:hypothetical protein